MISGGNSQSIQTMGVRILSTKVDINPYLTNGFARHYRLVDKSTFIFRGVRSDF